MAAAEAVNSAHSASVGGLLEPDTGELLRELTLDPSRDYQATGAPKGPTQEPPK